MLNVIPTAAGLIKEPKRKEEKTEGEEKAERENYNSSAVLICAPD